MSSKVRKKKVSLRVVSKAKNVEAVQKALGEAEAELGVKSEATVEEPKERAVAGWSVVLIDIGLSFAQKFFEKYGESVADWLAKKLGLDKSKGETVSEGKLG